MPDLPDEALRAILAGCDGVTPGPWGHYRAKLRPGKSVKVNEVQSRFRKAPIVQWSGFDNSERSEPKHAKNAAHIARLDPDTVRSIITELLEAKKAVAELDRLSLVISSAVRYADDAANVEQVTALLRLPAVKAAAEARRALSAREKEK